MPVLGESSSSPSSSSAIAIAEQRKLRRPRNEMDQLINPPNAPPPPPPMEIQCSRSKSTISSLFKSANTTPKKKFKNTFRGFGCTAAASQQVSLPSAIRTSADWDGKKVKKKKRKNNDNRKTNTSNNDVIKISSLNNSNSSVVAVADGSNSNNPSSCMLVQDVWCGPGIGFSADAVVGSVDCVVTRRNVSGRGKIDVQKANQRERERGREREHSSCLARRTVNPESFPYPFLDSDSPFASTGSELDVFGPRYYRHARHPSPDGLAEIMLLHSSLLMGGRLDSHDQFRDWRLDVDHMSYEELLELGDRIGYVSTGLKEDEIGQCLRKLNNLIVNDLSSHIRVHIDRKCTICQEEYEADDEMGKLDCGHSFHIQCIKQWLAQKNACPVCKMAVVARC